MVPSFIRPPGWQECALGLYALVLYAPFETFSSTDYRMVGDKPQPKPAGPAPPGVAKSAPDPIRERRAYKTARSLHGSDLSHTDRSLIPRMMQAFRRPPNQTEEYAYIDWLAERDALIDRALALGFVIGELSGVVSGISYWSAVAKGHICSAPFIYPTGGQVSPRHAPPPKNGDAALMNRGWAMLDNSDTEPRPYIPVPRVFLPEPKVG